MLNRLFRNFFKQSINTEVSKEQEKINTQQIQLAEQIAHELASPLAAIRSVASLSNALTEQQQKLLEVSANRIEEIVNRIRAYNKRAF